MPLVRIDLIKGKSAAHVHAIGEGVHRALVEVFKAPADDRFQVITQHEPGSLVYDPDYLSIHRTDDVVFVFFFVCFWFFSVFKKQN